MENDWPFFVWKICFDNIVKHGTYSPMPVSDLRSIACEAIYRQSKFLLLIKSWSACDHDFHAYWPVLPLILVLKPKASLEDPAAKMFPEKEREFQGEQKYKKHALKHKIIIH
jgi:hypothetical protein